MKSGPLSVLLLLLAAPFAAAAAADDAERVQIKERELEQVRARIGELKERLDERAADRDRLTAELEAAEVAISKKRARLEEIERQKDSSEQKLAQLDAEIAGRQSKLAEESDQLAEQALAAFVAGREERIRLLLNQQDPATLGRLLVYYRYLSAWRGANIERVTTHLEELSRLHRETADEEDRLARLASERFDELTELQDARAERTELLASLDAKMAKEGSEVERLTAQEEDLERLIADLARILSDYPITSEEPFPELKGRLTWPIAGRLVHGFGQRRGNGPLTWHGVVLAAPRGREVHAVYHGRVIFADWLDGLGLLVIVDHGNDFITLYGYNGTTLKSAGDWVAPGDVIATVGTSGGQRQPSLYFEIRKGTQPIDPRDWFSRRPGETVPAAP